MKILILDTKTTSLIPETGQCEYATRELLGFKVTQLDVGGVA